MTPSDYQKIMGSMLQQSQSAISNAGGYANLLGSMGPGALLQLMGETLEETKAIEERKKAVFSSLTTKIEQLTSVPAVKIAMRMPDYVGTLTAWRGWKVVDGKLYALGTTGIWEPKQAVRAACSAKGIRSPLTPDAAPAHEAPAPACKCGYWSFRTMELLQAALEPYAASVQVVGSIEIWGKVVECANGFRSEFAYPKELWLLEEGLEHLSWTYGVPVRIAEMSPK